MVDVPDVACGLPHSQPPARARPHSLVVRLRCASRDLLQPCEAYVALEASDAAWTAAPREAARRNDRV